MPRKSAIPEVPKDVFPDEVEGNAKELPKTAAEIDPLYAEEPVVPTPIRAVVPRAEATDHHLIVGMSTLASMTDEEFERNLAIMEKGQVRLRMIQEKLLVAGEDYGRVKGIDKPFLHQPGAEKLANFYGLAVRQEAERIVRRVGDDPNTPPFAYHVKSFVHLGDTSGPIVAEGYGEANVYEERYHYRWTKPACPTCGKTDTLIKRKSPPQLAGKFSCANWGNKGGCGAVFEPSDPRIGPQGKEPVPDADLYGLAETILLIASKRSHVHAVRRATGTSGLFTQDSDSPSVVAQSEESGDGDPGAAAPVIESATIGVPVAPGGKTNTATQVQHTRLKVLAMEKGLNGGKIADLLSRLFGMDVAPTGPAASAAVRGLNADQMGQLLLTIETGELPTPAGSNEATEALLAQAWAPPDNVEGDPEAAHGDMADHAAH